MKLYFHFISIPLQLLPYGVIKIDWLGFPVCGFLYVLTIARFPTCTGYRRNVKSNGRDLLHRARR